MRPVNLSTSNASVAAVNSAVCPMDWRLTPFEVTLQAIVTGTVSYLWQYTNDDVFAVNYNPATGNWFDVAVAAAATAVATLISPVTAVRLRQESGAGSVAGRVVQAGN